MDGGNKCKLMKNGDTVILDLGFNNSSEVKIIKLADVYTCVTDGEYSWYAMTNRLSELKTKEIEIKET